MLAINRSTIEKTISYNPIGGCRMQINLFSTVVNSKKRFNCSWNIETILLANSNLRRYSLPGKHMNI